MSPRPHKELADNHQPKKSMKTITLFALALLGSASFGTAQDTPAPEAPKAEQTEPGARGQRAQRGQRGEPTEEQRAAMEERRKKTMESRAAALAKLGKEPGAEFTPDEMATIRAEVIAKYATEGSTELTPEQRRKAMEDGHGWALGRGAGGPGGARQRQGGGQPRPEGAPPRQRQGRPPGAGGE
jgi:hypothetical protein